MAPQSTRHHGRGVCYYGHFFWIAGWLIHRNLRDNEPGLRAPPALPFALAISAAGIFGAWRLPSPYAGAVIGGLASLLFCFAVGSAIRLDRLSRIAGKSSSPLPVFVGRATKPTDIPFFPATRVRIRPLTEQQQRSQRAFD